MRTRWLLAVPVVVAAAMVTLAMRRVGDAGMTAAPATTACPANAKKANLTFTLKDMDGKSVTLADYKGKVLLLDFFATWCGPCKIEIPAFVDLYTKYKSRGFEIAGVIVMDEFPKARPFAQQFKINYPVLNGEGREDLEDAFGPLFGLPTSFMIGRDGSICQKHVGLPRTTGPIDQGVRDTFEAAIKSLL
jgi:peroxiredoxin